MVISDEKARLTLVVALLDEAYENLIDPTAAQLVEIAIEILVNSKEE